MVDPYQVVATLLRNDIDPSVAEIPGHLVESRWNGEDGNRTLEVLGNLLGGTDARRLEMCMDQKMVYSPNKKIQSPLY